MFASEDLNAGLKVVTVRCAYLQCNYKLLYTMVLVRNGTPGIQGEVTNIQSSNTLHRTEQSLTETQAFHSEGKIQGGAAVRNPQWVPPRWGEQNKQRARQRREERKREREREKKREDNKQANEPGRTPSLSHNCSLHWRLERYGFSSETWKALSMCMLGKDFTQAEMGLTSIWPQFHMEPLKFVDSFLDSAWIGP